MAYSFLFALTKVTLVVYYLELRGNTLYHGHLVKTAATTEATITLYSDTLNCYQCLPDSTGTCTEGTATCATQSNHMCSLLIGSSKLSEVQARGCGVPEECVDGSLNLGTDRTVVETTCCSTDLCNTNYPAVSSNPPPNGKKCFFCDGQSCTNTLNCVDDENYCVKATVSEGGQTITMKGCASKSMCLDQSRSLVKRLTKSSEISISCCQGDFCNKEGNNSVPYL
uniref:UPAR/Ly6 domain-containing protein n=1 Tax=Cyprinodon variegatus TaxID=28743 RepID=A0A3Q2GK76_CYPVA